ncbi:hypothetical protein RJ639_026997 [Escallonia herrerae]|uniref:Stigma-specific STIG1-like protein 1 n=1 Tax=Escallonia herrerae TaxID=1293975 RepID=A0AA88X516_9ASTE|nr:hypothetical protein RJ639_026997 [Escallonia herrerae]
MLMALAITHSATPVEEQVFFDNEEDSAKETSSDVSFLTNEKQESLRGSNRFLAQKPRARVTCTSTLGCVAPRAARGGDCCRKKCVNVETDRLNCGRCGRKCKYSEICCKGVCVNPRFNKRHCGGCNNKCKKGSSCTYTDIVQELGNEIPEIVVLEVFRENFSREHVRVPNNEAGARWTPRYD